MINKLIQEMASENWTWRQISKDELDKELSQHPAQPDFLTARPIVVKEAEGLLEAWWPSPKTKLIVNLHIPANYQAWRQRHLYLRDGRWGATIWRPIEKPWIRTRVSEVGAEPCVLCAFQTCPPLYRMAKAQDNSPGNRGRFLLFRTDSGSGIFAIGFFAGKGLYAQNIDADDTHLPY